MDLEHEVHLRRVGAQLLQRLEQPRRLELDRVRVQEEDGRLGPVAHQLHRPAAEEAAELGLGIGPELARDVEQLHRALGEARHAAAAERLVGGHASGGERHDGLEENRHRALVDELADLRGSGDEVAAEGRGADERALVVPLVLLRHVARDAELVVPDVEDVALVEGSLRDRLAVEERAVAAAEVADPQREPVRVDLRVGLRDVGGRQDELEPRRSPDPEGQGLDRRPLQHAVVAEPALEHPEARRPGRGAGFEQPCAHLARLRRAEAQRVAFVPNPGIAARSGLMLALRPPRDGAIPRPPPKL